MKKNPSSKSTKKKTTRPKRTIHKSKDLNIPVEKQSEKMKAVQHFISGTTREIQHPLKGLYNHTQHLIEIIKIVHLNILDLKNFKIL